MFVLRDRSVELELNFRTDWPIRQGDVFGFWDWRSRPPLNRFGMIISADCDIANGQPDQELIYLRIIPQSDYVDIFWSRTKLLGAREQALRDLVPQLNKLRRDNMPDAEAIDSFSVSAWVMSSAAEDIADAVNVAGENRAKLLKSVDRTRKAMEFASVPLGSSCLENLLQLRNQELVSVLKQAANDLRSTRDDIFFLTGLTDQEDMSGYYVLLDQIGAVRRDQIGDSIDAVKSGQKPAYRFGTLSKTYKYAVAQRFAFLFQKIGLPNEHNDRLHAALARLNA